MKMKKPMAQQHSNLEPKATRDQALQQRWRTAQHHQLDDQSDDDTPTPPKKHLAKTTVITLIPNIAQEQMALPEPVWYRKKARPA